MGGLRRIAGWTALLGLGLGLVLASPARAQVGSDRYASIVIDAGSGAVMSAVNPDEPRYPASLTKMMTLYMAFEALRDRRIALEQLVPVSAHAASMPPTRLGLTPGSRLTVREAILSLVTKSANDAAAALGELLGGDEARFAQMMTLRARGLGMRGSVFRNASGLPDAEQVSTARDLAILARRLVQDFPVQYGYFSTPSFTYRGRVAFNHDRMLTSYPGADGIKTGYTEAAGRNLVTSALRGNVRLIGVVLGAATNAERDVHMAALLDQGFERLDAPRMDGLRLAGPAAPRLDPPLSGRLPGLTNAAQAATLPPPATRLRTPPRAWAIQVGSFAKELLARRAAAAGRREADAGEARVEQVAAKGRLAWRAQVVGLSQADAQGACAALLKHRSACIVLRPDQGDFASR